MFILIRLPNWLGDGVMFSPAFELLKSHFKDAHFVLVGSIALDLFANDPRVAKVYEHKKPKGIFKRIKHTISLGREIKRKYKPIIAIDATNHAFGALLLQSSGSKMRIGYSRGAFDVLLTHALKRQKIAHQVMEYALLLSPFLAPFLRQIILPDLKISQSSCKNLQINDFAIAISPGASFGAAKTWPFQYFGALICNLIEQNIGQILLLGGPNEKELNNKILHYVKQKIDNPSEISTKLIDLSAQLTIKELANVISKANIFIGNDSGPMHISVALGVKTIAIFGPTKPFWAYPWCAQKMLFGELKPILNPNAIVLNKYLFCAPCLARICPLKHQNCMFEITPKQVLCAINRLKAQHDNQIK
ncbi:MAG: glycosyltransferase family 9 protein [Helicobacter sp.]|nr:glycosyltransferase family 9 protein [Helicobacter sp.]